MANTDSVRIIGGSLRGRRVPFHSVGIRPSPDRVRETLFNWLAPEMIGARCLDAFSGSGALGFEAASRGAQHVLMLDLNPKVVAQQHDLVETFKLDNVACQQANAMVFLKEKAEKPFDIVFLDPPFNKNWLTPCLDLLAAGDYVRQDGFVYVEAEAAAELSLSKVWLVHRSKVAAGVRYHLLRKV